MLFLSLLDFTPVCLRLSVCSIMHMVCLSICQVEDEPEILKSKCQQLAQELRDCKHVVVYTGAGISTVSYISIDYQEISWERVMCNICDMSVLGRIRFLLKLLS